MRFLLATMGVAALALNSLSVAGITINEVRTDMTGTDTDEYVEFKGIPGESLAGLTLLVIGDGTTQPTGTSPATKSGVVEFVWRFGTTDVIGANGYLVLHKATMTTPIDPGAAKVVIQPDNVQGVFENSQNSTFLLVQGFSGTNTTNGQISAANGQDLDTNDDGILEITPWTAIIDSMAVKQSPGTEPDASNVWWYSTSVCGPFVSRSQQTTTTSGLLAYWSFNNSALLNASGYYLAGGFPLLPDSGTQSSTAVVDLGGGQLQETTQTPAVYRWLRSFTGTIVNAQAGGIEGGSLAVEGGTGATATGGGNNGGYLEFRVSMAGLSGLDITWAAQRTNSGFNSTQVSYSTDGATYTNFGTPVQYTTSFARYRVNFGNLLDGAPDVRIRLTLSGATDSAGNNRLDNIQVRSSPTEGTWFLLSYGSPFHCIRNSDGSWSQGRATPSAGLDTPGSVNVAVPTFNCGDSGAGDCSAAHDNASCSDACCCEEVCATDPFCCQVRWDTFCAAAAANCTGDCGGGCTGDLDGNDLVNGDDLGILLTAWGPSNGPADLNGDGSVNGDDLGLLLVAWGPCPAG